MSDLLERDGWNIRPETRKGGEWSNLCRDSKTGKEWVSLMREVIGVNDTRESVDTHYPMPTEALRMGAFVGYRSHGTTAMGCVARTDEGLVWMAPGSSVPSNTEARRSRRRTAKDGERVWFGCGTCTIGLERLQGDEWCRLNNANTNDDEERAARWANGNMP